MFVCRYVLLNDKLFSVLTPFLRCFGQIRSMVLEKYICREVKEVNCVTMYPSAIA